MKETGLLNYIIQHKSEKHTKSVIERQITNIHSLYLHKCNSYVQKSSTVLLP